MKALSALEAEQSPISVLLMTSMEEEVAKLVECLDKAFTAYGMEISAKKTRLMTNSITGIKTEIKVNEQKLETVASVKYLGSFITDEGPKPEILSRIALQQH